MVDGVSVAGRARMVEALLSVDVDGRAKVHWGRNGPAVGGYAGKPVSG
jgi:hypothetical protein